MDEEELSQADLSQLRLQEMTPVQRAELRRRYDRFVRHFIGAGIGAARGTTVRSPRQVRKWFPGMGS